MHGAPGNCVNLKAKMASQTSERAEPTADSSPRSPPLFYERVPAAIEFRLNLGTIKREAIKARKSLCAGEMTAGINVDTGMFEMKVCGGKRGTRQRGCGMGGWGKIAGIWIRRNEKRQVARTDVFRCSCDSGGIHGKSLSPVPRLDLLRPPSVFGGRGGDGE